MVAEKIMRVLLISPLPPPAGGIATWTEQYIDWANQNYLNVDIVNTAVVGKRAKKINSDIKFLDEYVRTTGIIKELKNKIIKFKPDVIHLNTSCGKFGIIRDYLCAKMVKQNKAKLVVHYRCNIEDQISNRIIQKHYLKKLADIADVNLVLNSFSKDYLYNQFGNESILISNFIDRHFIFVDGKVIKEKIEVISFVGHIQKAKGALEIFEVAKNYPDIIFKLAGPVASEIKDCSIPSNIKFMGQITKQEVKELLVESDVFLFPSHTEGFANAILEAMASGLPIVTTPVGANEDMVESAGGLIIRTGDCVGLVNAIDKLNEPNIRSKMSEWNINKVSSDYTTEKVMKKLLSIYLKE